MRLVFMGTSRFALPSLEALVHAGHDVVIVVTQPDRPSGRGLGVRISPIKEAAQRLGLALFQPEKIREEEAVERIRSLEPLDVIVVAAFGQIIPKSILEMPKYGCINVHASLLPKYRGAAPIQHAVAAGETLTGVTTMLMDPGLDTGDILLQAETEIGTEENSGEVEDKLAIMGADLLIKTLDGLEKGEIIPVPQDNSHTTLAPSIKREAGEIDWTQPAEAIVNKIRGFTPRPGAYTVFEGRTVKVLRAKLGQSDALTELTGQVLRICTDGIEVAAGQGTVILVEVQPEGRNRMSASDFARGTHLQPNKSHFGRIVSG